MAAEPARARIVALRRRAQRQDHPARPPFRHRLARGALGHERAVGRDRARGVHLRPRRLHRRAVSGVRQTRRLDRAARADADRPEAPDRTRRRAGRPRRPRRLVPPHRPRPALELGSVPPPRPQLRRRRAPERQAAPARRPAARHRLLAREGLTGHRPGRVHRRRPRRPRRPAPPVRVPAQHGQAREPRLQAAGARDRRPRPLRRRGGSRPRRQQDLCPHERRRAAVDAGAEQDPAARAAVGPEGGEDGVQGRRQAALGRPSTALPLLVGREAGEARQARARGGRDLDRRPRSPRGGSRWWCRRRRSRPHGRSQSPCRSRSPA